MANRRQQEGSLRTLMASESLLLLTAAIWGIAFVFQRTAMDHIGPFTFNALRFALGALVMLVIMGVRRQNGRRRGLTGRRALLSGLFAGLLVFGGATFQQVGIVYTTAGKAGFITGLYIVLVPMLGIFWGHRPGRNVRPDLPRGAESDCCREHGRELRLPGVLHRRRVP